MPPLENQIKCTWCTQTFSSIGNLNTHFRDFLPELPFYQHRSGPPRGSPFHPPEIVREHLRKNSLPTWRDQLAAKDPDKARARVIRAFAAHSWSNGEPYRAAWRDRKVDAVSRVRWGRIVDAVCARFPNGEDTQRLHETVQQMVQDAVKRTFVGVEVEDEAEEQEEDEEVEEEEPPARPGKRHRHKKAAAPEADSEDATPEQQPARRIKRQREKQPAVQEVPEAIDEYEDDDVRFMYDRDGTPTPGPKLLGASFNSSLVKGKARDVGVNKSSINFGVKVAVNNPEASVKPSSPKECAISERDEFFPLLLLSVAVFRLTELVPAEIYTTWDEVKDAIATLLQEPDMKIVLVGCGGDKWDGVWDEEVWEDVKCEADLTAEPLVYSVKLKLGV